MLFKNKRTNAHSGWPKDEYFDSKNVSWPVVVQFINVFDERTDLRCIDLMTSS